MPMRVLVTGGAGFVGRHMVAEVKKRGCDQIVSVDLKPMDVEWNLTGPAHLHVIDDMIEFLYRRSNHDQYDLVIHCAAHVGGRVGIDGNKTNLARNLHLDSALFEWAVRTEQPRIVYYSSAAAYPTYLQQQGVINLAPEPPLEYPFRQLSEDLIFPFHIQEPDADYGLAKLYGERMAARARSLGVNVHVIRPFSGYGEDQSPDYPFPAIVARARERDLSVWGPPGQTRDWIYIDDVIAGTLAVVDADYQEPVNLCTGIGTEMGQLMRMMVDQLHLKEPFRYPHGNEIEITYQEDMPTGVYYRVGDPTVMNRFYTAKIDLAEGIRRALTA